ncbi:MAG: adenylosuccinate lyase [Phycisphaerales bacterium]|nr:adenylosuccinate lyase [Phycisphaerales bacterium]
MAPAHQIPPQTADNRPGAGLDGYRSPLEGRYASAEMRRLWSAQHRIATWRRIWLVVAQAQQDLGLPITGTQLAELRASVEPIPDDFACAAAHEARLRHDVMAHVHAWGDRCPNARGIIHLGLTSQDVVCNADALILREALRLIGVRLAQVIDALGTFAEHWKALATVGYTHGQPAQPTTVGRRAAQWAHDLKLCFDRLVNDLFGDVRIKGLGGATGTQASFLQLFDGDAEKVRELDRKFCAAIDPDDRSTQRYALTGQTYPRVVDSFVLADCAAAAAAVHKMATDLRLLIAKRELDEPFEAEQIGSSAMPYKRNPMRCERACALARFVMHLAPNAYDTAATQWFERTLDDSANRRLSLPEAFLALDGALLIMHNVASGLVVHEAVVRANLASELPFLATENLMMEAAKLGRDRQQVHEAIRQHAIASAGEGRASATTGADALVKRLKHEPLLAGVAIDRALEPERFIGLAVAQTEQFMKSTIEPLRQRYAQALHAKTELRV